MDMSLGNVPRSDSMCTILPLGAGDLVGALDVSLGCKVGTQFGSAYSYGINPQDLYPNNYCVVQETDSDVSNVECSSYLNTTYIDIGLTVAVTSNSLFMDISDMFVAGTPEYCMAVDNSFFIQYSCVQEENVLYQKYMQMSLISILGLFCCFLYLIMIYFLKRDSKLNYVAWDVQTITPGDYSVEYNITETAYKWFMENVFAAEDQAIASPGYSLKLYLKKEIETQLTEHLNEKRAAGDIDPESIKIHEVKIADIVFAFNNSDLIGLLRERGGYINNQKYDKMREAEQKITDLKKEKYESLTRPVCAFITFEEEDGYILA
mmetsp:Transcript_21706/g.16002  ORF Transcript_21706/g.16002 Transcript_21706/m.16002 type:complete len:320 (+) Transcript_21706:473-1432(+)